MSLRTIVLATPDGVHPHLREQLGLKRDYSRPVETLYATSLPIDLVLSVQVVRKPFDL